MQDWLVSVAAWWGGTALGGGLVLLLGCWMMRRTRDPATRQRVGEVAIGAALLVAVLRIGPAWLPMPLPSLSAAHAAEPRSTLPAELSTWVMLSPQTELVDSPQPKPPATFLPPAPAAAEWGFSDLVVAVTAVYVCIVAAFLARWMLGQWSLARLRRAARPASPEARGLFARMAGRRLWPQPLLGLSRRLSLPIAFGLRRPAVLLPEGFDTQADETTLRWVFAHELTHLRRRDPWSYWAVGLAQAVYFYVPWFWWVKRQIRLCQEYVADAAAAREGAAADDYAEFLVNLAKGPATPLGAAGLGSTSDLFRRVQMLLQTSSRGPAAGSRRPAFVAFGGLLTAALLASGIGVRAEQPKPSVEPDDAVRVFELVGDAIQGQADGTYTFTIVNDDDDKKDKKKEEKKSEKKRVLVLQQDGKNIITIPVDADVEDVKKQVEKALADAKRQSAAAREAAEVARNAAAAARDRARAEAEKARAVADVAREKAEKARKESTEEKREVFRGTAPVMAFVGEPRLGVRVEKPSAALADQLDLPKGRGLVVVQLVDDSPAGKAGVKVNDVILEFKGNAVPSDVQKFVKQLRDTKGDESAEVIVLRKGKKEKVRGIKLQEVKSGEGGAVFQVVPGGNMTWSAQPKTATGEFKGNTFQWKVDESKDGDKGEKKEGRLNLKLDGMPKIDAKDLKFDIQLDGVNVIDGKKLSDSVRKQVDAKLKLLKEVDGKALSEDARRQIELKLKAIDVDGKKLSDDVRKQVQLKIEALDADGKKLSDDARKQIELKLKALDGLDGQLKDLQKKIELKLEPLGKLSEVQKGGRVTVQGQPRSSGESNKKQSNMSVSVSVNDGELKAVQMEEGLEITVLGDASGERVKVREIKIYSDGEKNTYRSIGEVPSKHREKVRKLIANQEGSPVRFRFEKEDR